MSVQDSTLKINNESILRRASWKYRVSHNRRVTYAGNSDKSCLTRILNLRLPLFLHSDTWERHQYTLEDILLTVNCFSPFHLWPKAIWMHVPAANSAVKPSCAHDDALIYGGKAIACSKIIKVLETSNPAIKKRVDSVLLKPDDRHTPPLPVHGFSSQVMNDMKTIVPDESIDLLKSRRSYDQGVFSWKDISVVPVSVHIYDYMDNKSINNTLGSNTLGIDTLGIDTLGIPEYEQSITFILMARVISEDDYTRFYGKPDSIAMQPQLVNVEGQTFCITDESFYIVDECHIDILRKIKKLKMASKKKPKKSNMSKKRKRKEKENLNLKFK